MLTLKRRYTCEWAVLITMDQLPLLPRHVNTRLRHVSLEERNNKLATLAVESIGRLGVDVTKLLDQLAASVVGAWG